MTTFSSSKRFILVWITGLFGIIILSGCGIFTDRNEANYTEAVEDAENQATIEAQTFEDIGADVEVGTENDEVIAEDEVDGDEMIDTNEASASEEIDSIDELASEQQRDRYLQATNLIEAPVLSLNDEALGEIEEFAFSTTTGQVAYAIIEFDGALGLANETVAIPAPLLTLGENQQVFITIDREVLETAPGFDTSSFTGLATEQNWTEEADAFWSSAAGHANLTAILQRSDSDLILPRPVSTLVGREVLDAANEVVAEVEEVIFSFSGEQAGYAILSIAAEPSSEAADTTGNLVAVPLTAFDFEAETDDTLFFGTTGEMLGQAPRFGESDNLFDDSEFLSELHRFWTNQGFDIELVAPGEADNQPVVDPEPFEDNELYDDSGINEEAAREDSPEN